MNSHHCKWMTFPASTFLTYFTLRTFIRIPFLGIFTMRCTFLPILNIPEKDLKIIQFLLSFGSVLESNELLSGSYGKFKLLFNAMGFSCILEKPPLLHNLQGLPCGILFKRKWFYICLWLKSCVRCVRYCFTK